LSTKKITLEYFLKRNNVTLKNFIKQNNINNYDELVLVCIRKYLVPCEEKFYENSIKVENKIKEINVIKKVNVKKSKRLEGKLVNHAKNKTLGIVLKKSKIHNDYYLVMTLGNFSEWHISNIYERK